MNRFKVGDTVVCVIPEHSFYGIPAKVHSVYKFKDGIDWLNLYFDEGNGDYTKLSWYSDRFEYADIFNSPLYNALKQPQISAALTEVCPNGKVQFMSKFKLGDRVVFMPDTRHMDKGTVVEYDYPDDENVIWAKWDSDGQVMTATAGNLISEDVYNSPLYKALK